MGKYILARSAGFCFGVERSMQMAQSALEEGPCYCLGELIHNRDAVSELENAGLHTIEDPAELPVGERVLIRAHGIGEAVYEKLEGRSARIIDATCPLVRRIHKIVQKASLDGRQVVIIGDRDHPEIRGICGWCRDAVVLPDSVAFEEFLPGFPESDKKPISVVFQTTQIRDNQVQIEKILKKTIYKSGNL